MPIFRISSTIFPVTDPSEMSAQKNKKAETTLLQTQTLAKLNILGPNQFSGLVGNPTYKRGKNSFGHETSYKTQSLTSLLAIDCLIWLAIVKSFLSTL